jgi:hypothetical protein
MVPVQGSPILSGKGTFIPVVRTFIPVVRNDESRGRCRVGAALSVDQLQGRLDLIQPRGRTFRHPRGVGKLEEILVPNPALQDLPLAVDRQERMAHDGMRRVEDGRRIDEGPVEIRQEGSIVTPGAVAQPRCPRHNSRRVCACRPLAGRVM